MASTLDPSSHSDASQPSLSQSGGASEVSGASRLVVPDSDSASTERLRAIADSSFDLICELDSEGQFTYQSPTFAATTGTGLAVAASVFDFVPLEDRPRLIAEYTAALAGTRIGRTEHRLQCIDGDQRWFESALRGIGTGVNRRVVMVSREITARQRHQLELESLISLSKTVHIQGDFPSIARVTWEQMRPLLPVTALLLAWKNGGEGLHVAGQTSKGALTALISPDSHPEGPLWSVLKSRAPLLDNAWNGPMVGFDFPVRSFVAVPLSGDDGAPEGEANGALLFASERPFVWTEEHQRVCLMIAEQTSVAVRGMKMLDSTREAETRYRSLVNDVNAIVWEVDAISQGPTFVSQQAGSWLGYSAEELRDRPKMWLRVIHPDERRRVLEEIRKHKSDHAPWQLEFRACTAHGKEMWLQVLITPEIQDGNLVRARGLTLDVTQLYLHVDALLQTNAILEATQEASADGICLVDDRGQVVSHNPTRFEGTRLHLEHGR
ncbi:PAS domain S-box protein, partial [bacterium]